MKFLADENVEWPIVLQIRKWGHEVIAVRDIMPGAEDTRVLKLASEENWILLTNDNDFGTMVFHQKAETRGVILMRFSEESSVRKIEALDHLLKHHKNKLADHFTVITENQIKIRPL